MSTAHIDSIFFDCDEALVAELKKARRSDDPSRPLFNKVETYNGQRGEVLAKILREHAPCAYVQLLDVLHKGAEHKKTDRFTGDAVDFIGIGPCAMIWSILILASSLRSPRELTHGGPGVVGAFEILEVMIDTKNQRTTSPAHDGKIRGRTLVPGCEPFQFMGAQLLAQNQTAVIYDAQFRTRAKL